MSYFFSPAFAADEAPAVATSAASAGTAPADAVPYDLSAEKMMWDNFIFLGVLFFIFYFVLISPQRRRVKQHEAMIKTLQKGNKVLTIGGMFGTIVKFEGDDIVVLEISQGVRIRVSKASIADIADDKIAGGPIANDN